MTSTKNSYFNYNLPVQYWPDREDPDNESGSVLGARILNYMPRRERCEMLDINEVLNGQTHEAFCEDVALHFENLARMWREVAKDPSKTIYYHDEGMTSAPTTLRSASDNQQFED